MIDSVLQLKEIITAQRIFHYFFFFMLGYSFELYGHFILEKYYAAQFILTIVLSWIILDKGNGIDGIIIHILMIFVSVLVINILFTFARKFMDYRGLFSFLGEKSLEIYIFHVYITAGIRPVLKVFHVQNFWIAVAIATFLGIMLPIIGSYILKKVKLWNLFFKPASYLAECRKRRTK